MKELIVLNNIIKTGGFYMSKNTISLNIYDGSEGMEYIVHKNGDVNITTIRNGSIESEIDVDVECFDFETPEGLIADLIDQGYEIEWPV